MTYQGGGDFLSLGGYFTLAAGAAAGVGWLYALADKRLGAALTALHADPARCRTVQAYSIMFFICGAAYLPA